MKLFLIAPSWIAGNRWCGCLKNAKVFFLKEGHQSKTSVARWTGQLVGISMIRCQCLNHFYGNFFESLFLFSRLDDCFCFWKRTSPHLFFIILESWKSTNKFTYLGTSCGPMVASNNPLFLSMLVDCWSVRIFLNGQVGVYLHRICFYILLQVLARF